MLLSSAYWSIAEESENVGIMMLQLHRSIPHCKYKQIHYANDIKIKASNGQICQKRCSHLKRSYLNKFLQNRKQKSRTLTPTFDLEVHFQIKLREATKQPIHIY